MAPLFELRKDFATTQAARQSNTPPALSDDEASDVEAPPFPPLSSRNSPSVADDGGDGGDVGDAGIVDKPVAVNKKVAESNGSEDEDDDDDEEDMAEDEYVMVAMVLNT